MTQNGVLKHAQPQPSTTATEMQARANDRENSLFAGIDLSAAANAPEDPIGNEDLEASSRQETLSPVLSLVDRILIEAHVLQA